MVLSSAVDALITAWLLDLFGFGNIFISGCKEFFGLTVTINGYYFVFFLVGLAVGVYNNIYIYNKSKSNNEINIEYQPGNKEDE